MKYAIMVVMIFCFSCGQKLTESDYTLRANMLLSQSKCSEALEVLTHVKDEDQTSNYFHALSSAHACTASYSLLTLFSSIADYDNASTNIFNFFAKMDISNETSDSDVGFTSLKLAIDSILYLNSSTDSTHEDRLVIIKNEQQNDELSFKAMIYILGYLGKWMAFYGDVSVGGLKGSGSGSNNCFTNYSNAGILSLLDSTPNRTCDADQAGGIVGHPSIVVGTSSGTQKLCQPLVYINHLLDILPNVTFSTSSSLGDLASSVTNVETLITNATTSYPGISDVLDLYDVDSCITFYDSSASNALKIQAFIAAVMENNLL
jgi:hypothetical protein